jgi:hypothetical protein
MKLLIFATGNPPIPEIYNDFYNRIKLDHPDLEVLELPFYTLESQSYSLEELFDQCGRDALQKLKDKSYEKVILAGHSIGASIILSQYKDLAPYADQTILIHPFIKTIGTNEIFLKFIENPLLNFIFKNLLLALSLFKGLAEKLTIKYLKGNNKARSIARFVSDRRFISRLLKITSDYITYYKENNLFKLLGFIPTQSLHYIFSPADFWSPDHLWEKYPGENKTIIEVDHDFCLHKDQSEKLADVVSKIISGEEKK